MNDSLLELVEKHIIAREALAKGRQEQPGGHVSPPMASRNAAAGEPPHSYGHTLRVPKRQLVTAALPKDFCNVLLRGATTPR